MYFHNYKYKTYMFILLIINFFNIVSLFENESIFNKFDPVKLDGGAMFGVVPKSLAGKN